MQAPRPCERCARVRARELRSGARTPAARGDGPTLAYLSVMLVSERDWILLRARLRCFVALTALPRMTTAHLV